MNFDLLSERMRSFETLHAEPLGEDRYIIARLDGRGFTRLTKELLPLERPFDEGFTGHMAGTAAHVMECGFKVAFGYTQSDEISVLVHPSDVTYSRKPRKLLSVLAGEASAKLSLLLGRPAVFDCRISLLPDAEHVVDYFRWRQSDAGRNALNAHCYWQLRHDGLSARDADARLSGLARGEKEALLSAAGISYDDLPVWQLRGVGLLWEDHEVDGYNPKTGETTKAVRRRILTCRELPAGAAFADYVRDIVSPLPLESTVS